MTNVVRYELTLRFAADTEYWAWASNYEVLKEFAVKFRQPIDKWFERNGYNVVDVYICDSAKNLDPRFHDRLFIILELTEKEYFLMRLSGREQTLIEETENHIVGLLLGFNRG